MNGRVVFSGGLKNTISFSWVQMPHLIVMGLLSCQEN